MRKHSKANKTTDILVIGAGPVGLICSYLGQCCELSTIALDKSKGPLEVGRADALNARTLQLLEIVDLFDDLYPLGKQCNTSSVWANGEFVSRQSSWWKELQGCFHKHFLMLGQSFVEQLLDHKLKAAGNGVLRSTSVENIELNEKGCLTTLTNGDVIQSRYIIGADGSQSYVRRFFDVPFEIIRPRIVWAVIDGILDTDFPKVPEIIVFQAETSDVAWIPREGKIDRFYIRMDTQEFTIEEAIEKINRAIRPHTLSFKKVEWFSQFTVKESVAERFFVHDRVFLAGDASHVHSVNGGQGLNTGLADAFNLIWKLNMVVNHSADKKLLTVYEDERRPVAKSVIDSSGELVRSTKYSETGTHAQDYVKIVERRAGNITGMGIRYSGKGLVGSRIFDFKIHHSGADTRLYSLLDYTKFTLLIVGECEPPESLPDFIQLLHLHDNNIQDIPWRDDFPYHNNAVLIRPDAYIEDIVSIDNIQSLLSKITS